MVKQLIGYVVPLFILALSVPMIDGAQRRGDSRRGAASGSDYASRRRTHQSRMNKGIARCE